MTTALAKAVHLRIITRRAVDVGDDDALRFWARRADAAQRRLQPSDAAAYDKWIDDTLTDDDRAELQRLVETLAAPEASP